MNANETEKSDSYVGEDLCARTAGKTILRAELCQKVLEALASCPPTRQEPSELQLRYNVHHKRWEALSWKALELREVLIIFGNAVLLSADLAIVAGMPLTSYAAAIYWLWGPAR